MNDPMTIDIRRIVAGLVRSDLRALGQTDALERFRADSDAWTVRLLGGELYVVAWRADGEIIDAIPAETVALGVGLLRAKRDARTASLN